MAPLGTLSFDDAYDIFREMLEAGEAAGADLVVFETMSDLLEVKAGVLAAREHTSLPVWVTMTLEKPGRTFVGVTVPAMALTLSSLGVEALGFNCSLGPAQLLPMVEELIRWTNKPIILKPNAGLPDTATGAYTITPADFVREVRQAAQLGVHIFGGCCGTGPDYISALRKMFAGMECIPKPGQSRFGVCSASCVEQLSDISTFGQTISPENPDVADAVRNKDYDALSELAMEDMDEDAEIIQVYLPEKCEAEMLPGAVQAIQSMANRPLLLRARDPQALEQAIRVYNGRPVVAVTSPEAQKLCCKYGAQAAYVKEDKITFYNE